MRKQNDVRALSQRIEETRVVSDFLSSFVSQKMQNLDFVFFNELADEVNNKDKIKKLLESFIKENSSEVFFENLDWIFGLLGRKGVLYLPYSRMKFNEVSFNQFLDALEKHNLYINILNISALSIPYKYVTEENSKKFFKHCFNTRKIKTREQSFPLKKISDVALAPIFEFLPQELVKDSAKKIANNRLREFKIWYAKETSSLLSKEAKKSWSSKNIYEDAKLKVPTSAYFNALVEESKDSSKKLGAKDFKVNLKEKWEKILSKEDCLSTLTETNLYKEDISKDKIVFRTLLSFYSLDIKEKALVTQLMKVDNYDLVLNKDVHDFLPLSGGQVRDLTATVYRGGLDTVVKDSIAPAMHTFMFFKWEKVLSWVLGGSVGGGSVEGKAKGSVDIAQMLTDPNIVKIMTAMLGLMAVYSWMQYIMNFGGTSGQYPKLSEDKKRNLIEKGILDNLSIEYKKALESNKMMLEYTAENKDKI